jgi:hypothetical protein
VDPFVAAFPTSATLRQQGHRTLAEGLTKSHCARIDDRGFEIRLEWWLNALESYLPARVRGCAGAWLFSVHGMLFSVHG